MNIKRNIFWSILDFLALPIGMLISVPIFLEGLGTEVYGFYLFVTSIVGINAFFNLGFGDTAIKYLSHHLEIKNIGMASRIQQTLSFCSLIAGFFAFILIFFNLDNIKFAFELDKIEKVDHILLVSTLIIPLKLLETIYIATMRSLGKYNLAGKITITTKVLNLSVMIICVLSGLGLFEMMLSTLFTCLGGIILLFIFSSITFKKTLYPFFFNDAFREIYTFSGMSWLQGLSGLFYANADKFILSYFFGMTTLAFYGVCLQVAQNLHSIYAAASHTLFPLISRVNAKSGIGLETRKIFKLSDSAITFIVCIPMIFICIYSYQILEVWVGKEIASNSSSTFAILIFIYGIFSINSISTFYIFNGIGKVKIQTLISLISASIMFVSSLILIPNFGVIGAALCRLPDALIRIFIKIFTVRRILKIKNIKYIFDFIFLLGLNSLIILLLNYFFEFIFSQNYIFEISLLFLNFFIYLLFSFSLGYKYFRVTSNWISIMRLIKKNEDFTL